MKIYLVSSGTYSDFKIDALFSNIEKAEAYINGFGKGYFGYNDIKEFDIDPEAKLVKNSMWTVWMHKNGFVEGCAIIYNRSDILEKGYSINGNKAMFTVDAKDEEHAIKIANEIRVYLIANEAWMEKKNEV